jgi:flavin-dependent dehydrogenase
MKALTIVGGGLAGLSLGIGLRQAGVPVTVIEAGQYPRHRVCGEFLSGHGRDLLRGMGVYEEAVQAGAREAKTARFFSGSRRSPILDLPSPALCLSRYRLDELLARTFVRLGGELQTGTRYQGEFGEGVIRATGRQMQTEIGGWRWIGLKAHARNVSLDADLEMHFLTDGYVGLCRVEGDAVNVCGLFRSRAPLPDLRNSWRNLLSGPRESTLTSKLSQNCFLEETFSAVAGLPIRHYQWGIPPGIGAGDALGMISPVTGNGMSLAIESALNLVPLLGDYSAERLTWGKAEALARNIYQRHYGDRLRWAGRLQAGLFQPLLRPVLFSSASHFPSLFKLWFRLTHG